MFPIPYPSPRVSQLDANILDSELFTLLKDQLSSIFQLHENNNSIASKLSYNRHPETYSLLLNLLIFKLTVWKSGASYGSSLQNLKLTDSRTGKVIGLNKKGILLAALVGTYLYKKVETALYQVNDVSDGSNDDSGLFQRLKNAILNNRTAILTKIDNILKTVNLLNFTVFLVSGRYPSILHRLLGITETPIVSDLLKFNGSNVNYEFQNRQLVWNVMTEFLVFLLPLLQLRKISKFTKKMYHRANGPNAIEPGNTKQLTPYTNLPVSECAICHYNNHQAAQSGGRVFTTAGPVTNPCITNCGHVYCYVCIATQFNVMKSSGDDVPCLKCGTKLEWFKEFEADEKAIDVDAITIKMDIDGDDEAKEDDDEDDKNEEEQKQEKETGRDDSDDNDSIESGSSYEIAEYSEKPTGVRIERKRSSVSNIFQDEESDSLSEDDYSEEEEIDADEAML
ncbi:PEX2 [Candida margitis]|uniref:PEX2 n=1 Tax=Candida margitis TaxID=1775924 RepID=UPI002225EDA3|nr:PEX2 [Candida margitis]KAI5961506.1 PEX2 [Candida margitis]